MCFRFGSETSVAKILDPVVFGVYLASVLITVFVCIVITKRGQIGWSDASLGALVAAWPNTGFMGVPMLATLLGTASVGPVMLTMLIDVFEKYFMRRFVTIGFFGAGQHGKSFSSGSHACCEQSHALGHSVWNPGQCL